MNFRGTILVFVSRRNTHQNFCPNLVTLTPELLYLAGNIPCLAFVFHSLCLPQCLSNTQPLTEYFLGTTAGFKPYMKHLNRSNPLGMGGIIAESYGALLEEIWSGKYSCVSPRRFKVS